jgi:hypothetical protein
MASCHRAFSWWICFTTWKIHPQNSPFGQEEWRLGLAHFHNEYSFLMIYPNLHDIVPLTLALLNLLKEKV